MSAADDPFGPPDKTVIRPAPASPKKLDAPANPVRLAIAPASNATVFDPGALKNAAPAGWSSGTVVFAGKMASDAGERPADAAPSPRSGPAAAVGQDDLLAASEQARYDTANPLLAAAAPLLTLFGRLRVATVERQPEALARHISDAIQLFETRVASSETREEDARIAKFVLCETADDIVANLPGMGHENWKPYSLVRRFFRTDFTGSGTFDALNKVLAHPEAHYDLIELIHFCLSLGFEGQYRRLPLRRQPARSSPAGRLRHAALLQGAARRRFLAALARPLAAVMAQAAGAHPALGSGHRDGSSGDRGRSSACGWRSPMTATPWPTNCWR